MAINSIYTQSSPYADSVQSGGAAQSPFQQIQQQVSALGSALSSGNLTGAQSAFSALQQLLPSGSASSRATGTSQGTSSVQSAMQTAMTQLQQALSSGNTSAAQTAFTELQQAVQHKGGHHRHHGSQSGNVQPTGTQSNPASANSYLPAGSSLSISA